MAKLKTNLDVSESRLALLDGLLADAGFDPAAFRGEIHPKDEMYHNTVGKVKPTDAAYLGYLTSGFRSYCMCEQITAALFGGIDKSGNFLEFASGHGRLTRFLVDRMPEGKLWVSDIYESAMEFQTAYFGVNTIQSVPDPEDLHADTRFDVILAGSLFTHLPDALFAKWLAKLGSLLTPQGVLFFSVRLDYSNVGPLAIGEMPDSGILFTTQTESDTLSTEIYGRTVVSEAYLTKAVQQALGSDKQMRVYRKALYENQDLVAVAASAHTDLSKMELRPVPFAASQGGLVKPEAPGQAEFHGWGIELTEGCRIKHAILQRDGQQMDTVKVEWAGHERVRKFFPGTKNPSQHFVVQVPMEWFDQGSVVSVRLPSTSGQEITVFLDPASISTKVDQ
ncbi:MAG: class I SAM-dependent methyltransferase [Pseudomonadota bacterium]